MSRRAENKSRAHLLQTMGVAAVLFTLAAESALSENLLPNSSFKLTTNQTTPDYWDLHHAAALRFRNLHAQYNLVESSAGPVFGARVLRITNSESDFPFVYLLSKSPDSKLPAGNYLFSVYAKADRAGNVLQLAPSLGRMDQQRISVTVSIDWRRYTARFRIDDPDKGEISPVIAFPSQGTYWVSAPQLEFGSRLTDYAPAAGDARLGVPTAAQRSAASEAIAGVAAATTFAPAAELSATFEFNVYAGEPTAHLKMTDTLDSAVSGAVVCSAPGDKSPFFSSSIALGRGRTSVVDIPISGLMPGEYACAVGEAGHSATAKLAILAPKPLIVRMNRFRNTLEVNGSGYHIRGVMVGSYVPPEWYFSDIVNHGINTLFFYPPTDANGDLNAGDLDRVLQWAEKYGVKVILGPPVMGQRNSSWKPSLERYSNLVSKYRNNPAIIGWFVVDEPQAWTLREHDLVDIYDTIKTMDPYRLVFVNWGSDDVPLRVGAAPHGTLGATDLYSIDYYPFTNGKTNLESYTLRTIRALKTGMQQGKPGHSWLQLYGYLDVIREPTGEELNYMAYVNLLYGGNYSYWQTKSNAKPTWDQLGKTNKEISVLTNMLMLNPDAVELKAPTLVGHYLYSVWKTQGDSYLIVLHMADETEYFDMDLKPIFGPRVSQVRSYFDKRSVGIPGAMLKDSFGSYATRVYEIN
jgi:hypothetical protein